MTVRVTVKTHGCPAHVSVDGADPVTVDHHQQQTFDVSGSSTITVNEEEPSAEHGATENPRPFEGEEVPGRAQNDALLGKTSGAEAFDHDGDGRVGGGKRKAQPPADESDASRGSAPAV